MAALVIVGACAPAGAEEGTSSEAAGQLSDGVLVQGAIEVRLDVPARPLGREEFQEQVKIVVTNVDDEPIRLVAPGDGSSVGWRTPTLGWSVLPADSTAPRADTEADAGLIRCGNINAIREDELLELDAGESVEFDSWLSPPNLDVGTFRVAVHYLNDPTLEIQGVPLGDGVDSSRLRKTTLCSGWSPETLVSITN